MKKFLSVLSLIFLFFIGEFAQSAQYKVIVIPDNLLLPSVDYYVYTQSADLISTDVINYINKADIFYAPSVSFVRKTIQSDMRIKMITRSALADFKNTYNIDFEAFKQIGRKFSANYILLITCNIDSNNYMFRRTAWDLLNIPGATVMDPAYRLSTEAFLLDLNAGEILWQSNYQKLISSREGRIMANTFSPVAEQLEKIKNYSSGFLAPQIAQETQTHIDETIIIATRGKLIRPEVLTWDKGKAELKKLGKKTTKYSYLTADAVLTEGQRTGRKIKKETKKQYRNLKDRIREKYELMQEQRAEKAELKRQQKELKEFLKNNPEQNLQTPPEVEMTAPTDDKEPIQDVKNIVPTPTPQKDVQPKPTSVKPQPKPQAKVQQFSKKPVQAPKKPAQLQQKPKPQPQTKSQSQQQIREQIPPLPPKTTDKEINAVNKTNTVKQVKPTKINNTIPPQQVETPQTPVEIQSNQDVDTDVMPYAPSKPRLRGENMVNDI